MKFKMIFSMIAVLILVSCAPDPEEGADITITSLGDEQPADVSGDINHTNTTQDTTSDADETTGSDEPDEPEGQQQPNGNYEIIGIEDLKFKPDTMTIDKGTMIKWIHNDLYADSKDIKHIIRVYREGDVFNLQSQPLFFGDSFNYTFTEPGKYYYISIVYSARGTRGEIIVE